MNNYYLSLYIIYKSLQLSFVFSPTCALSTKWKMTGISYSHPFCLKNLKLYSFYFASSSSSSAQSLNKTIIIQTKINI
jgi:hypothetical protein